MVIFQLWLLKEWVDVPWVVNPDGIQNPNLTNIPPHLVKCYESDSYSGVCPSEGFYFTIVCLGKIEMR